MIKYYNPHPQGKNVADCVKRAITCASCQPYDVVSRALNRYKKISEADTYNNWHINVVPFMNKFFLASKMSFPARKGQCRMTGSDFCQEHDSGIYVLQMANHVACVKDGVLYDSWDSSDKCVYTAYCINNIPDEPLDNLVSRLIKECN